MNKFWFQPDRKNTDQAEQDSKSAFRFDTNHLLPIEFEYEISPEDLGIDLTDLDEDQLTNIEEMLTEKLNLSDSIMEFSFDTEEDEESYRFSEDDSSENSYHQEHHINSHSDFNEQECFICRDDLCETEFFIRLGGLTGGFSNDLKRFIGCRAAFDLTDGSKVKAEISSVNGGMIEVSNKELDDTPILITPQVSSRLNDFNLHTKSFTKKPIMLIPTRNIKCFEIVKC